MESYFWFAQPLFDLIQTLVVVSGLFYTAYSVRKDEKARTEANMIAVNDQYTNIWAPFYERPELERVLERNVDLKVQPVSAIEVRFIKRLFLHLDFVRRMMNIGNFIKIQELEKDVRDFFEYPIPKDVWGKIKPFQDSSFIEFVERCQNGK
jgi:hypothetical protein